MQAAGCVRPLTNTRACCRIRFRLGSSTGASLGPSASGGGGQLLLQEKGAGDRGLAKNNHKGPRVYMVVPARARLQGRPFSAHRIVQDWRSTRRSEIQRVSQPGALAKPRRKRSRHWTKTPTWGWAETKPLRPMRRAKRENHYSETHIGFGDFMDFNTHTADAGAGGR